MKKLGKALQWIGYIVIVLYPFYAWDAAYKDYVPIIFIIGVTLGLLGSLLEKASMIGIVALSLALLAVIAHFFIEHRLIYKVFILSSLGLVVLNLIMVWKENQSQKSKQET